ncbi:MAG: tryptophanase [Candidatus Levybacteria bacterium]|nr:tryptophanase [Candidatus Levybacteria bacterium]
MTFQQLYKKLPSVDSLSAAPRPYINHSVEFKRLFSTKERIAMLEKVGLNVFFFPSEMITGCDLLSDSGTTTMTNEQWAALHVGDEAYGSNRGYFLLLEQIAKVFGEAFVTQTKDNKPTAFLFHQGRAAEHAFFSLLSKNDTRQIIPSNGHFDTTAANIEANNMQALNLFSPLLKSRTSDVRFKGDMDTKRLLTFLKISQKQIPLVYLTITNNTGGGQPVSLKNIREVSTLLHQHNIPLFLDACRFAENAWFIKQFEKGYREKTIQQIVGEIFSYADGFSISFKKDGLSNIGGGIFFRKDGLFVKKYPDIPDRLMNHQILTEGHPTYGGMSGRDIMALVVGLQTIVTEEYLSFRINQVQEFGKGMQEAGLPVIAPFGGHAIYLDMTEFFRDTDKKPSDFGGIAFTAMLLGLYGHRACELGNFAFGSYNPKTRKESFPEVNFVRFAVPRLRYEKDDLASVVEATKALYQNRQHIPKITVMYGLELPLRHFKSRFAFR